MKTAIRILGLAALSAGTSAFALEPAHLVQPNDLAKWWLVSSTGDPKMPAYGKNLNTPTCAAVSYRIDRRGTTSEIKLEKVAPAGDLGAVAVEIVKNLHYTATQQNLGKDPVYTYVVLPFNAPDINKGPKEAAQRQALLAQCQLQDFKLPAAP